MKPKPLGDLLRQIRLAKGLSLPYLAERAGVTRNTLTAYEQERTLADPEFLARFAKATGWDLGKLLEARINASQFSPQLTDALKSIRTASLWVAKFVMRRAPISDQDIARLQAAAREKGLDDEGLEREFGALYPVTRLEQPRAGYVYLPLYDVQAAAGGGKLVDSERVVDALAFKEDWIRQELRAAPCDLRLIYVEGDSMEPDLRAGDIVLVDHSDTSARREGIYVIRMDNALLVKQLQRLPGGIVKVISRNAAYEPFTISIAKLEEHDGFAVVGRVVWACRRF